MVDLAAEINDCPSVAGFNHTFICALKVNMSLDASIMRTFATRRLGGIWAFSALALLGLTTSLLAADTPPTADALIAAAKQATGGPAWDKIVTWHEKDVVLAGGLTGTAEAWADFPTLHNSGSYKVGPASGGSGWDGTRVWTTDSSGEVRIESSEESVADATQDAYRSAYAFFFPGRFPDSREYAGPRQADGKTFEAVKLTPKGADPFEIWIDPASHRIARAVQLTGAHPQTFILSEYAPFGGIIVPRKIITRVAHDPKFDIVSEATSIEFTGPEAPNRYAPPPPPADTAQWPPGKDSVTIPFRLLNNHIYIDAAINGHPPVPFVFDTGATNVISVATAKQSGVSVEGALPQSGFGNDVESTGLAKVKSVSLGGLSLPDQVFTTEGSAGWTAVEGIDSGGLVGYEFAKRTVLTIDYANRTMTFTKPTAFHPPDGVTPVSFAFSDHIPMIPAQLDGIAGEFELDTGSRGALTVMAPFATAHGLISQDHAKVSGTVGYGVGGPAKALLGRAGQLTIGSVMIHGPITEFVTNKSGGGNETHTAGNIGGDILKRFTVTLDYAHQLAWFQPNALNDQPEVFDRSGLWIDRSRDGDIGIADVTTESPAAKAGLVTGDEIVSINGKPARDTALYDLREEFKGAVGTKFDLVVQGKAGRKDVALVLADQV
jgi:hypothetical protein